MIIRPIDLQKYKKQQEERIYLSCRHQSALYVRVVRSEMRLILLQSVRSLDVFDPTGRLGMSDMPSAAACVRSPILEVDAMMGDRQPPLHPCRRRKVSLG